MLSRAWLYPHLKCHSLYEFSLPSYFLSQIRIHSDTKSVPSSHMCSVLFHWKEVNCRVHQRLWTIWQYLSSSCFSHWTSWGVRIPEAQHNKCPESSLNQTPWNCFIKLILNTGWKGIGVIPSKLISLGLCGRTTMLYFYHVLKV